MSAIITFMPSRPKALAIARPRPDAPPVMKATLSRNSFMKLPLVTRFARTDAVEAFLDVGDTLIEHRLELGVGEDVEHVVLDRLAHELANIERVDALVDTLLHEGDEL